MRFRGDGETEQPQRNDSRRYAPIEKSSPACSHLAPSARWGHVWQEAFVMPLSRVVQFDENLNDDNNARG
jgi:hypothetical protein